MVSNSVVVGGERKVVKGGMIERGKNIGVKRGVDGWG